MAVVETTVISIVDKKYKEVVALLDENRVKRTFTVYEMYDGSKIQLESEDHFTRVEPDDNDSDDE